MSSRTADPWAEAIARASPPPSSVAAQLPNPTCPECGAVLASGRACLDYFHDLLTLEAQVPGAPGAEPHFLAVATYNLQHPAGFMPVLLLGLRQTVADVLAGRATVADARRRARRATDGETRVRRRADTPLSAEEVRMLGGWPTRWAMTVRDVSGVTPDKYVAQVRQWARGVTVDLETAFAPTKAADRAD